MDIPQSLKIALENQALNVKQSLLVQTSQKISERYRAKSGSGSRLVADPSEVLAYCVSRMPATFCSVSTALKHTLDLVDLPISTLLDVGAGTGAAAWAASELLDLTQITCLEREESMITVGTQLMSHASPSLKATNWINHDIRSGFSNSADLVVASYVLNELSPQDRQGIINRLWHSSKQILLLVEPGTPAGFETLKFARKILLQSGANIVAPCTNEKSCPIPKDDWCHFSCRVARSKLHKLAKGGDAPYEDEKFCFLAVCHQPVTLPDFRILRHPQISSGFVKLEVCSNDGIKNLTVTKKQGEKYKHCRKCDAGDCFND